MNPHDLLDVANTLVSGVKEAEWRSGVSRAYYATFHIARELLLHCGFDVPPDERAHAYLWLRLANSGHPDVSHAGRDLRHLRSMRNWADYDLAKAFDHPRAIDCVQLAETIFQLLESVPTIPAVQAQITAAMKIYERDVLKVVTWHP